MPYQSLGFEQRKKLIHTVGVIGNGRFVMENNPFNYTGIFVTGAENVLIRLSTAKEPATHLEEGCLTPAVALKFLRAYTPSANVFVMYSLMGQDSFNFFKHDLSNHPPDLGSGVSLFFKLLRKTFAKASNFPTMLGLSDIALADENGQEATTVKFPFRLVFHPTTQLHNAFPDDYPGIPFTQQLMKHVQPGTLYDIYVQDTPMSDQLTKIGRLDLLTPLTTSYFGDRVLFLQHTSMESDLTFFPDWEPAVIKIMEQQQNTTGYNYPDLPFENPETGVIGLELQ
eukprot:TRINITY_DN87_c0_g1_i3.p1 TRINITY_DN87_c0_g1~~TRINITY_DN87_c0_g1_i3.p1  ORF type:complete len:332 (+),score=49.98 TRINITY_DN87_c0_g1_i3:150-998(+)